MVGIAAASGCRSGAASASGSLSQTVAGKLACVSGIGGGFASLGADARHCMLQKHRPASHTGRRSCNYIY